jgi:hypothetical protein
MKKVIENVKMSHNQKSKLKFLYILSLSVFLLTLVQFFAQFWIWGNLMFKLENELIYTPIKGSAMLIASEINREFFTFFTNQVFPIAFLNLVSLFFLEVVNYKTRKFQKNFQKDMKIIDKLEILRRTILKIISIYAIISWFLIPMNAPQNLSMFPIDIIIWQVSIPYYFTYFTLLALLSIPSYLTIDEIYFKDSLLEKVGFYKSLAPYIGSFK